MNAKQLKVSIAAAVVAGCLLLRYLSYSEELRPLHFQWLSLAILVAAVGASAAIWLGSKR